MLVRYGFKDIYGIRWDDEQVNRYNDLQKRIQAFEVNGWEAPSELKMESYKVYQAPYYSAQGE
jgi:hypothetical protein